MKATSELLKEIRISRKLTQKQFAKKFFVSAKTVSNYENGVRTPDLHFLSKICEEFNITLDYFMEKAKSESNPQDLVRSEKNGKFALFDTRQSVYLTQHLYDNIIISESGNHIVVNTKKDGEDSKRISYSAICDNFGNIKEFPNLEFGFNGRFDLYNVCPAYNKKTKKVHLVNNNGEVLSKAYSRIRSVSIDSETNFGLYFGFKYVYENGDLTVGAKDLLYIDGKNINVTFVDIKDNLTSKVKEYKDINILVEHLKKYGPNVIELAPEDIFKESENYCKIIFAANEFVKDSKYDHTMMAYILHCLNEYAEALQPKAKIKLNKELIYPKEIYVKNCIAKNLINKSIDSLYDKIGLI